MSAARWRSSRVCAGLHSAPVRRSVDKEIGATREVVVIRFIPWPQRGRRPAEWQSQPHRKRKPALEFFQEPLDRKSSRLNSSHVSISYAVFCLKKKKKK